MNRLAALFIVASLLAAACGTQQRLAASCHEAYPDICIYRTDEPVTCTQITSSNFRAVQDPYGFDANGDGIACGEGDH